MNLPPAPAAAARLAQLFCREVGLMVADLRHALPVGKDICPPQYLGDLVPLEPFLKPRPLHRLGCMASIMWCPAPSTPSVQNGPRARISECGGWRACASRQR